MVGIGSAEDAERALRGGMGCLAEGGQRTVFRDPDGSVVYKVSKPYGEGEDPTRREHDNAELHAYLPHVPPTTLFHFDRESVLAMPYYPIRLMEEDEAGPVVALLKRCFPDTQANNVRRGADGRLWLIDLESCNHEGQFCPYES